MKIQCSEKKILLTLMSVCTVWLWGFVLKIMCQETPGPVHLKGLEIRALCRTIEVFPTDLLKHSHAGTGKVLLQTFNVTLEAFKCLCFCSRTMFSLH